MYEVRRILYTVRGLMSRPGSTFMQHRYTWFLFNFHTLRICYAKLTSSSRYTNTMAMQGGEDGGSDIGALLGNLAPLISSLSGVSSRTISRN
jgi:hypothetical protein